jgi:hypothetical protein
MKLHANHRTCPSSRRLICRRVLEEGWTLAQAAAAGCSERTASKRLRRATETAITRSSTAHRGHGEALHACPPSAYEPSRRCGGCG